MTTRILPPEEWPRLAGTELETLWPLLDQTLTRVVVVERDAQLVGVWAMTQFVHLEGLWIAPEVRRHAPGIGRRLLRAMFAEVRRLGARFAITGAATDDIRRMVGKIGGRRLPGESYVVPIPEGV